MTARAPATPLPSGSAPAVTVIVPTRNRAGLLGRTLNSVIDQRDVDVHVVVVDDGSSDDTTERVRALDLPNVEVLRREQNEGVAAARNAGTELARTRWVAWCDDDDRWAPGKLRAQLEALDRAPSARWAASSAVVVDTEDQIMGVERSLHAADATEHLLTMNLVPAGGSGVLAERSLFDETGGFDPGLSVLADWDLWTKFALRAEVVHVDLPHVAYLRHAGAMSRRLDAIDSELDVIRRRFSDERSDRALKLDEADMLRWITGQHVRARRRWMAARCYMAMATRHGQPEASLKALLALIAPDIARRRDLRPRIPDPAWTVSAGRWFEDTTNVFTTTG